MTRVAINGFGRIGRAFLRSVMARSRTEIEVVAINDLGDPANLAYLLKYDTVYGRAPFSVRQEGNAFIVNEHRISLTQEKDPAKLPWKDLSIDVVVECTGFFTDAKTA